MRPTYLRSKLSAPLVFWVAVCFFVGGEPFSVHAQSTTVPALKPLTAPLAGVAWKDLNAVQRQSLQPLEGTWGSLSDGHKRKWIALAQNYPQLGPVEQAKMHSRMAEWAALKPRARELARLNFAEAKKNQLDRTCG